MSRTKLYSHAVKFAPINAVAFDKQYSWAIKTFGKDNFEHNGSNFYFRYKKDKTLFLLRYR